MRPRTLTILGAVTVLAIATALAVSMTRGSTGAGETLPERLCPGLEGRINDVAQVSLVKADQRLELARTEDGWVVASKGGYPARFEPLKELIVGVADLAPRERKTANADLHQRLGLGPPGADVEATHITLSGDDGAEIVAVVLGKTASGAGAGGRFARRADADQTWLVETSVNARLDPMTWMERELLRISRDRIARATILRPGSDPIVIEPGDAAQFALANLPPDRHAKPTELSQVVGAASYLGMSDVRKAEAPPPEDAVITTFETDEGLTLAITTWSEGDDDWWAGFEVTAPEPAGDASESEDAPADADTPTDAGAEEDEAVAETPGPAAEAAALRDKLAGWAFKIESFKATQLRKTLDDLTEPAAAPEPEAFGPQGPLEPEGLVGPVLPPGGG